MRKFINIVENHDPGYEQAEALMKQYGTKPLPFSKLPPGAKKAVHHWMMVDGENDEYKKNCWYSYADIPIDVFFDHYFEGVLRFDPQARESWKSGKNMLAKYQKKLDFKGYDFGKHDLENPWPVIIGSEFFEDGAHRLALYAFSGMKTIPAVMIFNKE